MMQSEGKCWFVKKWKGVAGKEESFEECGSWKSGEDAIERN
jgi:hypothetical protein